MPRWLTDISQRIKTWRQPESGATASDTPQVISRDHHSISRRHINDSALKVISRLRSKGFEAYLVGGGVRDLLLGGRPKDFDIATDAHPEQVNQLFRNSRIIGRRFKIVHVRFGREIIEVTTFRAQHDAKVQKGRKRPGDATSARNEAGMLLRDNVYGTIEEDAARRDFTINALYYTTRDFSVYDFANGVQDLNDKIVRMIGDPATRYREDPVRMLRAVRFAGKLDFTIEPSTAEPIYELAPTLNDVPAARMFDEVIKLFMAGAGVKTYQLMQEFDLFEPLFPATATLIEEQYPFAEELIIQALRNTDQRVRQGKPVTPAFIYAALLWPPVHQAWMTLQENGMPSVPALHHAAQQVLEGQQQHTAIPRRFSQPMREIWELQLRLPQRYGRKAENLMESRRFRAGYDFVLLREQAGEDLDGLGEWWTHYQVATEHEREKMVQSLGSSPKKKRRRPKKRRGSGE